MNRFLLVLLFVLTSLHVSAQTGVVFGTIREKLTGAPMKGVSVLVKERQIGTSTIENGNYSIILPPGKFTLRISHVGYESIEQTLELLPDTRVKLDLALTAGSVQLQDVVITSSSVNTTTSTLSSVDILLKPVNTSQDVLRFIPGLVIAQHAGGGKAEQIFLRGFDIDHGTDINLTVDGLPVNMVSHAHGQGYSDLHFVIPETIESVDFAKGPYNPAKGDFATAGYAAFNTISSLSKNMIKLEGGSFGVLRNVNMISLLNSQHKNQNLFVASELYRSDGYFESRQGFLRGNGLVKYRTAIGNKTLLDISASAFSSKWSASGQIPMRAVSNGTISRFGSIDDEEGGKTSRYNLNAILTRTLASGEIRHQAYASAYNFNLLSNFTFFLNDPINGDRIIQSERRQIYGYNGSYQHRKQFAFGDVSSNYGIGVRGDIVKDGRLSRVKDRSTYLEDISKGDLVQLNSYAFGSHTLNLRNKWSFTAAFRLDHFRFQYDNHLTLLARQNAASKATLSPKLSIDYAINPKQKLFVRSGLGFHSNDARTILGGTTADILPRAFGFDAGTEWKIAPSLFLHSALWFLDLEQELVYVGDEGIVEPSGRTRRKGVDVSVRWQLTNLFFADIDYNYTHARSRDEDTHANYVPLAPSATSTGGLHYRSRKLLASLRYRYVGDRPANEDYSLTAKGYFLSDCVVSWSLSRVTLNASVENIFNEEWEEAQFETESRLSNERDPVTEIHFTPGTPRFFKVGILVEF
jgi:hypothetical protein